MALIPEVQSMLNNGQLSEFDADWIGRLKPTSQLASALKTAGIDATPVRPLAEMPPSNKRSFRTGNHRSTPRSPDEDDS